MRNVRVLCTAFLVSSATFATGRSADVTPDIALFFSNTSDQFAMLGANGLLSTSGRAGLHRSLDGGRSWSRAMRGAVDPATGVEPFINGMCTSASNPSVVYAEALGVLGGPDGLYRSDDFGATWRSGTLGPDYLAIDCAVSSFDPQVVYVQAYSFSLDAVTVIKSADGGATWSRTNIPNLQQGAYVRTSPVDRNTVYVGDHGPPPVIYVSHDSGSTFSPLAGGAIRSFYLFLHPANAAVFLAAADEGLYRSDDAGNTVSLVLPGAFFFAFDPADPQTGYAVADKLYRTSDCGKTFSPTGGPTPAQIGFGISNVAVVPQTSQGGEAPQTSQDGGASRRIYVGTTLGPHRSDDGANTFVAIHNGYHGASVSDLSIDALGRLNVGVQHTVAVFRARNPAAPKAYSSFGINLPGSSSVAIASSPTKPGSMVVGLVFGGVFHTEDDGQTWAQSDVTDGGFFGNFTRMSFASSDASRVYLVTPRFGHGLYRSSDAGSTFTKLKDVPLLGLAVHPSQADVLYLGTYENGGGLFKSTDGGATLVALGQPGDFPAIAVDPRRPAVVYAGRASGGVIRTTDAGATWTEASAGLPSAEPIGIAVDGRIGRVFAWLQGEGLYQSDNEGASWVPTNDGESKRRSSIFAGRGKMVLDPFIPGRVYLGNSGVMQVDTLPGR
jgi:photosystem II stability/assembly factor-like uncharacterized protein